MFGRRYFLCSFGLSWCHIVTSLGLEVMLHRHTTPQMEDVQVAIKRARAAAEENRRRAKADRAAREATELEQRRAEVPNCTQRPQFVAESDPRVVRLGRRSGRSSSRATTGTEGRPPGGPGAQVQKEPCPATRVSESPALLPLHPPSFVPLLSPVPSTVPQPSLETNSRDRGSPGRRDRLRALPPSLPSSRLTPLTL